MNNWVRQGVGAARSGAYGLVLRGWRNRELADARVTGAPWADLRMVPLAAAGWGAAWVGTWGAPAGIAATAACVALALTVAALRRSALVLTIALVIAMVAGAGLIDGHRLRHGPVALLASNEAMVSADLEIRADPHRVAGRGVTAPAAAVLKAATVRVEGRGHVWLVRAPVLVVISGPHVGQWFQVPVGTRVAVDGRLEASDRGSDVAAVLRVRGAPTVIEPPSPGLRVVERVRAGLRRAVADRRPEARALVPALVLGDTSGLDAELTQDFQSTGLTHVSIRSRHASRERQIGRDLHAHIFRSQQGSSRRTATRR